MASDAHIKGEQANQILANPLFQDAFDEIINDTVQAIADSPLDDKRSRNQLGLYLAAATAFKLELFAAIDTARLEAQNDKETNPAERMPLTH